MQHSEFENLKRRELKHERKCPAVDHFATNSHLLLTVTFSSHSHHDAESAKMIGKQDNDLSKEFQCLPGQVHLSSQNALNPVYDDEE